MATTVADIDALLQATARNGRVVVAGGAVGGAIALTFAARRPERVRGVVGFGPAIGIAAERRPAILAHADSVEAQGIPRHRRSRAGASLSETNCVPTRRPLRPIARVGSPTTPAAMPRCTACSPGWR
ncbi:alpha/beta fold hydrolase [Bradyrhizobium sp. 195]|nr:alpha/beta fold hydrolase [Bradyrhizobium sp. 195]